MYTTIQLEAKRMPDENGDLFLEFPPSLMKALGWEAGDELKFRSKSDGSFTVQKVKYSTVELELDDEEFFKYMKLAHSRDITFSELVQEALVEAIKQHK
jgi:antitoxin component of MazEF toxin-antitoxin module